jgi:hypothetical protein
MPASIVQQNSGNTGTETPASIDVTLASDDTVDNWLILVIASDATVDTPAGWILDRAQVNNAGHYVFRKATTGTDQTWNIPIKNAAAVWWLAELEGLAETPFDAAASEGSNQGSNSRSTTTTTPATDWDDLYLIGSVSQSSGISLTGPTGWTNSHVAQGSYQTSAKVSGINVGVTVADRHVSATGGYETTASGFSTSASTGIIVAYRVSDGQEAGGTLHGGGSITAAVSIGILTSGVLHGGGSISAAVTTRRWIFYDRLNNLVQTINPDDFNQETSLGTWKYTGSDPDEPPLSTIARVERPIPGMPNDFEIQYTVGHVIGEPFWSQRLATGSDTDMSQNYAVEPDTFYGNTCWLGAILEQDTGDGVRGRIEIWYYEADGTPLGEWAGAYLPLIDLRRHGTWHRTPLTARHARFGVRFTGAQRYGFMVDGDIYFVRDIRVLGTFGPHGGGNLQASATDGTHLTLRPLATTRPGSWDTGPIAGGSLEGHTSDLVDTTYMKGTGRSRWIPVKGGPDVGTISVKETLPDYTGPMTFFSGTHVIEGVKLDGYQLLSAFVNNGAELIFRNCWFVGEGFWGILNNAGTLLVEDCYSTPPPVPTQYIFCAGSNVTLRRVKIDPGEDGIRTGTNCLYEMVHVTGPNNARTYGDAMQSVAGSNVRISYCYLRNTMNPVFPGAGNSVIIATEDFGPIFDWTFEHSYFENGANHTVDIGEKGGQWPADMKFNDIIMEHPLDRYMNIGPAPQPANLITQWDNVRDELGNPILNPLGP